MIERTLKAKSLGKKTVGRPRLFNGSGTRTMIAQLPPEWHEEKIISGQTWRYIIRKGLDLVTGKLEEESNSLAIKELKEEFEALRRNFHIQVQQKIELKKELQEIKNQNNYYNNGEKE